MYKFPQHRKFSGFATDTNKSEQFDAAPSDWAALLANFTLSLDLLLAELLFPNPLDIAHITANALSNDFAGRFRVVL